MEETNLKFKLQTFNEFCREIPQEVHEIHIKRQDGSFIEKLTIEDTKIKYGEHKMFNYFDNKNGTMDVFIVE